MAAYILAWRITDRGASRLLGKIKKVNVGVARVGKRLNMAHSPLDVNKFINIGKVKCGRAPWVAGLVYCLCF